MAVAKESINAEETHLLHTVHNLLDQAQDRLKTQIAERLEAVDTFFDGLSMEDEEEPRSSRQLVEELSAIARSTIRLTPEQQKGLQDNEKQAINEIREIVQSQVEEALSSQALTRLIGSIERRLEESLELDQSIQTAGDWNEFADRVLDAIELHFDRRRERLVRLRRPDHLGSGQRPVSSKWISLQ